MSTLLVHPLPDARLSLTCDASDRALGSVLSQEENGEWKPLAFFSRKLTPAEQRYSVYDRELLAVYASVRHFSYMLEGRNFTIHTDHKPLIYAFTQKHEKCSPRQIRHLDWIGQFSTDIRHISGSLNVFQEWTNFFVTYRLEDVVLLFRRSFADGFLRLHNLSHPGVKATVKLVWDRFLWPGYKKQVAELTRCCVPCQRGKIQAIRGPHLVVSRTSKYFTIQVGSRQQTVSIDRLKPAFQLAEI
ncbi:hypothetical protein AVEN_54871-1 [Araneus ventricosus]|uniref:RNA-directed DNA polymerase n=1 Tax=Araneus ventricosus TaxID=182803 RepID=A0A4Y2IH28_ARAVE|nr:hypothetical protein AVEN_54871-1 [Araneus ventricosus]